MNINKTYTVDRDYLYSNKYTSDRDELRAAMSKINGLVSEIEDDFKRQVLIMKITATYTDKEKTAVICDGDFSGFIPRTHRFWYEYKINELEEVDLILPYIEPEIEEPTPPSEAEIRNTLMESELTWAMIQRQYHDTGDTKRMLYSLDDLNSFAIACRDHVTHDEEGNLVIVGEIPKRPLPISAMKK